jgi:hypothetical protein
VDIVAGLILVAALLVGCYRVFYWMGGLIMEAMPQELIDALVGERIHPRQVSEWKRTEAGYAVRLDPNAEAVKIEISVVPIRQDTIGDLKRPEGI